DPAIQQALMNWLRRSPEHVGAYLDIAAVWMESSNVTVDADMALPARIELARADLHVPELNLERLVPLPRAAPPRRSVRPRSLAAIAAVMIAMVGAWFHFLSGTYSTAIGEQRSIVLADGSTVELNARSRLRVRFSAAERTLELLQGQALFQVKKDPARPFVVHSDDTSIRAVGTQFDVYRKPGGTTVTVVEGRVAVQDRTEAVTTVTSFDTPSEGQVLLGAGERLTVTARLDTPTVRVDASTATAWTRRELIFDVTPLDEVVAEFNRYNTRLLVLDDTQLKSLKITAIFRSPDPAALVRYLQTQPNVRIESSERMIRIGRISDLH
ncbi:FecR family protein, partial [Steroidobacter sp.]|uniref:FecR family protein n=1 Tax=Steroidobacter sp. TaxID=1978227 RepID=UPI001A3BB630